MSLLTDTIGRMVRASRDVDHMQFIEEDDNMHIKCYVSYDCDDDQVDDIFQALIDISCVDMAYHDTDYTTLSIDMCYPGSCSEADIYDVGNQARITHNENYESMQVVVKRPMKVKEVVYNYHV